MKTPTSVHKVPFDKLINLFKKRSEHNFILNSSIGKGYVQIFDLEKGLQARFWNCFFNEAIEMYSDVNPDIENPYFTLAFFLNMQGMQFANRGTLLQENVIWDIVFISAASDYKMYIAPMARGCCLSISFSKKWLNNNITNDNETFKNLKEEIDTTPSLSLLESMSSSERKLIQELFNISWKKSLGSFYIKSYVLKITCDFFYRIKERGTCCTNYHSTDSLITEVEKCLCNRLADPMPNLKELAHHFSMSESTLKRNFKKKYGVNMSTYFIQKKMEYAQHLIKEKSTTVTETAYMLGYKNVHHFIAMLERYVAPESSAA